MPQGHSLAFPIIYKYRKMMESAMLGQKIEVHDNPKDEEDLKECNIKKN